MTDELGEVHGGQPGVVNADGLEPGAVTIMSTSGGGVGTLTEWWAYDGRIEGPAATHLRGSCSCGWRGNPDGPLTLDLTIDRNAVTGTWVEQTAAEMMRV
ncbi:hypothetical protein QC334_00590 [Streptomyces sp. DH18]|uniref:hypothetical protein n=1 Tax=Streptomyces sp. DH18 TaxID=3040126 RepID=UPI0024421654|nr:hypothetical protein [Streptomyces sp. DH18]MDG9681245.1 hypothetical protein [Streptomyces sp. DH18]